MAVPRLAVQPLHLEQAPEAALSFAVLSNPLRAGAVARLNLRCEPHAVCDARVHPEIVHQSVQGRLAWKGRDTTRLSLALYAVAPEPGVLRGIGSASLPDIQQVSVDTCGLRDVGAPFGGLAVELQVYPITQWWTEVKHAAWPAMHWPTSDVDAPTAASCRLEADGVARDVHAWQKSWVGLRAAFAQGMEKVFNAWARAMSGGAPRLEVQAELLSGQASLTWGYRRTDAATALLRVEGVFDMVAAALDIHLSGELALAGARSRVHLSTKGRSELKTRLSELGGAGAEGQTLATMVRSFSMPFVVEIEPIASPDLTTLTAAATPAPMLGAVSGKCGLRPRPDGAGHQWFCSLQIEAVNVVLVARDPIVGSALHTLALLSAMPLLDWSAG